MPISARNGFKGSVTAIKEGPIHAEVVITTPGGDSIVATLTEASVVSLGLKVGSPAIAVIKAPWVSLMSGAPEYRFSARNQLNGTVSAIHAGAINSQVTLTLAGGSKLVAVVTNEAVSELGLKPGEAAVALFKAGSVLVGVPV
ncbi:TOBE domain-containing protein [Hydrogenophaga sp. A37]|uniref:TOBE domain-containing protein n=1 Tax=Hydrogenophaga sp. A37 TaxID=1945864 RepID=UPI000987D5B1|nr:TOBE domain-containing protein [Hydrogenophaga sp. A37]OOG80365.1 transporter [Hydrogenophaga sp. A37]